MRDAPRDIVQLVFAQQQHGDTSQGGREASDRRISRCHRSVLLSEWPLPCSFRIVSIVAITWHWTPLASSTLHAMTSIRAPRKYLLLTLSIIVNAPENRRLRSVCSE